MWRGDGGGQPAGAALRWGGRWRVRHWGGLQTRRRMQSCPTRPRSWAASGDPLGQRALAGDAAAGGLVQFDVVAVEGGAQGAFEGDAVVGVVGHGLHLFALRGHPRRAAPGSPGRWCSCHIRTSSARRRASRPQLLGAAGGFIADMGLAQSDDRVAHVHAHLGDALLELQFLLARLQLIHA